MNDVSRFVFHIVLAKPEVYRFGSGILEFHNHCTLLLPYVPFHFSASECVISYESKPSVGDVGFVGLPVSFAGLFTGLLQRPATALPRTEKAGVSYTAPYSVQRNLSAKQP
jgi:hypothetical protein